MSDDEIRAAAVREAARYLTRIYKSGLQSRNSMLNDLEAVAIRMEKGMTARGNTRPTMTSNETKENKTA